MSSLHTPRSRGVTGSRAGDRTSRLRRRVVETVVIAALLAAAFYFGPGMDLFH